MCLNIDGEAYCDVLTNAPLYYGKSLERVEHDLEENKQPYTEEVEELLARTCGLNRDVYRDRIVRIRSENVLKQIEYDNQVLTHEFGPFFVLSGCNAYIEGKEHHVPQIMCITPVAQQSLERVLRDRRFNYFCRRVDQGILNIDLESYPEHSQWIALAEEHLQTSRHLTRYCRELLKQDIIPSSVVFYPKGQPEQLIRRHTWWFRDRTWHRPPAILQALMTQGELEEHAQHIARHREIKQRKPKGKRGFMRKPKGWRDGWRTEVRISGEKFLAWKQILKERHFFTIERICFEGMETVIPGSQKVA